MMNLSLADALTTILLVDTGASSMPPATIHHNALIH
jgi:hypothetical protein